MTQSALSRRIKALENWAGAELVDRSEHPIRLTPAGEEFMASAHSIIKEAQEAQAVAANYARITDRGVTIACLHTLALYFVPKLIASLRSEIPPFEAGIDPETRTIEDYLYALRNGTCDFFICYNHPAISFDVDIDDYPRILLATDRIYPCASDHEMLGLLEAGRSEPIPFLDYGPTSIMSRVLKDVLMQADFSRRLRTVYRATLAESLATAAREGLGLTWLPESIARQETSESSNLVLAEDFSEPLEIIILRSRHNDRPPVMRIWDHLSRLESA